ncbi:hypothetical protein HPB48_018287 [Haemaphysalis longicornis]|uniref:ABC transporter domain-containing protein n=1 Tax=Haemaphysalis longicornis TaxID=44386 RepID=A0A9J6G8V3_HAELO|nr:hypothetical protein HPB48_018287 [Haemaphysalis longicornis]
MMTGTETLWLFGRLKGVPMTSQYIDVVLDIFLLREIADQLIAAYSDGNKRKLSLCVAMLGQPEMLLLDEPYVGIGATARQRIANYISALQKVSKMSILMSSQSLHDVEFQCDRIAIMAEGRLHCLGTLAHLKRKFGKGYTITVKTLPDRRGDGLYQLQLVDAVCRRFRTAELVHAYEDLLEFRVTVVRVPWSIMFTRMACIKKRFKLQDFFITDTSLEQIFLSVSRKKASDKAAATTAAGAASARAGSLRPIMAATLGI